MCKESFYKIDKFNKYWYKNGTKSIEYIYHRTNGPAIELANGTKRWYINGKLHREDGPAIEYPNGSKYWYINGEEYFEEEYLRLIKLKAFI